MDFTEAYGIAKADYENRVGKAMAMFGSHRLRLENYGASEYKSLEDVPLDHMHITNFAAEFLTQNNETVIYVSTYNQYAWPERVGFLAVLDHSNTQAVCVGLKNLDTGEISRLD